MNTGSSTKTLMSPEKHKGKEKVLKLIVESMEHVDFHSSLESSGDVHSLIFVLNGLKRGKGGKHALECLIVDGFLEKQEE